MKIFHAYEVTFIMNFIFPFVQFYIPIIGLNENFLFLISSICETFLNFLKATKLSTKKMQEKQGLNEEHKSSHYLYKLPDLEGPIRVSIVPIV